MKKQNEAKCKNQMCENGYIVYHATAGRGITRSPCPDCTATQPTDEEIREAYMSSPLYGCVDRWKRFDDFKIGYKAKSAKLKEQPDYGMSKEHFIGLISDLIHGGEHGWERENGLKLLFKSFVSARNKQSAYTAKCEEVERLDTEKSFALNLLDDRNKKITMLKDALEKIHKHLSKSFVKGFCCTEWAQEALENLKRDNK